MRVVEAINPSTLLKSRKTDAEAAHVRRAMEEDGAAMCEFYAWFEPALAAAARGEGVPLTELSVDERLTEARARRPGFVGLSFPTIAGWAANGAMPHYRATADSHAAIDPRDGASLLLIDSGAQYLGGTTDITRVWPVGEPDDAMRRDYTRVLKGTIALSRARFPRGTPSPMLDALARAPLWAAGLDYGHGTGHGVGYFLNVHEGPQSISKALPEPHTAMEPGMITSVEPGLYRHRAVGHPHREPGARRARRHARGRRLRRVPRVRDAHPVPDRHPPRRPRAAAARRGRLARRLPRRGAQAPRPAPRRRRAGLADRAHPTARAGGVSARRLALGVDLGGTKIEAAALDAAGEVRWRRRVATPQGDYRATLDAVCALVRAAEAETGVRGMTVGIGTPGSATDAGLMRNANSTCLNGQPLQADLERRLGRRLRLANDANCLALSEATDGAAAGAGVVFAVILGTGVGGGIVVHGRLLAGANGLAGEWGHNPLPWAGDDELRRAPQCFCGRRGCVETWLSGPALARDHAEAASATAGGAGAAGHTDGVVPARVALTAAQIAARAAGGDAACLASLERHEERLARALAGVVNLLDPDVIVLGGGLSQLDRLYRRVPLLWERHVFSAGAGQPVRTRLARKPPRRLVGRARRGLAVARGAGG